jgi:hypothetical protein
MSQVCMLRKNGHECDLRGVDRARKIVTRLVWLAKAFFLKFAYPLRSSFENLMFCNHNKRSNSEFAFTLIKRLCQGPLKYGPQSFARKGIVEI